ncbi:MAG: type I DNA topoisomerase [Flavobacteriales bacterium]|nr:type I DNA topoisomerase [Flavobacteriales bacterium]
MSQNLVIVESPAKAKTIEGFLGKDFLVKSSFGHIRDLSHKKMGVDIENGFIPDYEVSSDKKDLVKELKKDVKKADIVWLATDEDREGEAIAWHLFEALDLSKKEVKRIVFHEITKTAIQKAINNPRELDYNLVNAQQARRILDRLVGFELSPVLWKKVQRGLSAGRVQSVAVRLIAEQERKIQAFEYSSAFRIQGDFEAENGVLHAEYSKRPDSKEGVIALFENLKNAQFAVNSVESKPAKRNPSAPFTTSTLQQEASRVLSFSVSKTMMIAQRLYEAGKITYMRTDSVTLSQDAIDACANFITNAFGDKYLNSKQYSTKAKGAQEAHEAIRPTYMENEGNDLSGDEARLYGLIRNRTIASQMSAAEFLRSTIKIGISTDDNHFIAKGEILVFDGFLKMYQAGENKDVILPKVKEEEALNRLDIAAKERFSNHPPRFNEASLVRKMEELGIGRPSTYAPTISTIQKRNYVIKEDRDGKQRSVHSITLQGEEIEAVLLTENFGAERNKLFPTDIGLVVNDFLFEHFDKIMDYHFTANVENLFDEVAEGSMDWQKMLENFYGEFHTNVEDVTENSERANGLRELGVDPKTGEKIIVRIGRYGPMAQLGEGTEEEKPKFASLRAGQSLESITLEEAIELFKLPRQLGEFEGKVMTAAIGRFGPYIRHDGKFVSLKEDDPLEVSGERAIELILEKRQADLDKIIHQFDQEEPLIEVLKGRWGPFIKSEKKNYKIPKDVDATTLDRAACEEIMKNQPAKRKKATTRKKTTAKKKTTTKKK